MILYDFFFLQSPKEVIQWKFKISKHIMSEKNSQIKLWKKNISQTKRTENLLLRTTILNLIGLEAVSKEVENRCQLWHRFHLNEKRCPWQWFRRCCFDGQGKVKRQGWAFGSRKSLLKALNFNSSLKITLQPNRI